MTLSELNELDFNNIGQWPLPAKAGLVALVFFAVLGIGYWFDTQNQMTSLESNKNQEQTLKQSLTAQRGKALNLDAYKEQLQEMRRSFGAMIRQLPNQTEVAELLVDVSQTGLANGLEFELFQPVDEVRKDFYAEMPIRLKVVGNYHQFGNFVSDLAALPRIVTLHDIRISISGNRRGKKANDSSGVQLSMEAIAKTYRYIDDDKKAKKDKG